MNPYNITSNDGTRQWWADDASHAAEQHHSAFPDETILALWLDTTAPGSTSARHWDNLLPTLWHRIRTAIDTAGVSRADAETYLPKCHRRNCPGHQGDDIEQVFSMIADAIAESVRGELLCESATNPDLGDELSDNCAALQNRMAGCAGPWTQCTHYPRRDWQREVVAGDTQLGYWNWVRVSHDLFVIPAEPITRPLAVQFDRHAFADWWASRTDAQHEEIAETIAQLRDDTDTVDSLHWLMLAVFQAAGGTPRCLTISGLAAPVEDVLIDIDAERGHDGDTDGATIVMPLRVHRDGITRWHTVTAYIDKPHRDLTPPPLDDPRPDAVPGGPIGRWLAYAETAWIIATAAERLTDELNSQAQFWYAAQ
jgi:hypothetical protein